MKKKIYLGMLAMCVALTASACGTTEKTATDTTAKEQDAKGTDTKEAEGKGAEVGSTRLVSVDNVEKYITIGEYKGLTLDNAVDAITDEDVQAQIEQNLQDKAEPVSEGAQVGDLVTINYVGTIDGKTFDGGTANNYDFIVGNGQIFEEFENGVLDMKKGETKEITIDFASDYGDDTVSPDPSAAENTPASANPSASADTPAVSEGGDSGYDDGQTDYGDQSDDDSDDDGQSEYQSSDDDSEDD